MNEYANLLSEITKAISTGSVKLEDAPTLKKMVNNHLNLYNGQIGGAVRSLENKADDDKTILNGLSSKKWKAIANAGNNELNNLRNTINRNLNQNKINNLVHTNINNQITKAFKISQNQISQYFKTLNNNTSKVKKLSQQADNLSTELNKADTKIKEAQKRF